MRPVTQTDLCAAAKVLLCTPEAARAAEARRLIHHARAADAYRRATGRVHPRFGNGTLLSVALTQPRRDPDAPGDVDYLTCMALVLEILLQEICAPNR